MSVINSEPPFESEALALSRNPRYKKYEVHLQRVLATFDSIEEWPDIITFLSRLSKVVQSNLEFTNIPEKIQISRRLTQSLNPTLPAGVHQKALETYCILFETMGPLNLEKECLIWTSGLFPFYSNSSTTVKPTLLTIIDRFFLPLSKGLLPCLKNLLLALLPGLEEENGDFFDNYMSLLDRLSSTSIPSIVLLDTLWNILLTTPHIRTSTLIYLNKKAATLTGTSSLIALSIGSCLMDPSIFVKRSALDLLLSTFPLHRVETFLKDDLLYLMNKALGVVLKRDMSLNRRLFVWLFGEDENYFLDHVRSPFYDCLYSSFSSNDIQGIIRTFKILLSLVENEEISNSVVPELIPTILLVLYSHFSDPPSNESKSMISELLATAKMFLNSVDSYFVWKYLNINVCQDVEKTGPLIEFVVNHLRHVELDCLSYHIPLTIFHLLTLLSTCELDDKNLDVLLCKTLQTLYQYAKFTKGPTVSSFSISSLIETYCQGPPTSMEFPESLFTFELEQVLFRFALANRHEVVLIITDLLSRLSWSLADPLPFLTLLPTADPMVTQVLLNYLLDHCTSTLLSLPPAMFNPMSILDILFSHLKLFKENPTINPKLAVTLIWRLLPLSPGILEPYLIEVLLRELRFNEGFLLFGLIWQYSTNHDQLCLFFSRPLITILDSLRSPKFCVCAENWFHLYLTSYRQILMPLLTILTGSDIRRTSIPLKENITYFKYICEFDYQLVEYAFEQLTLLFQFAKSQVGLELTLKRETEEKTFFELISELCLEFMNTFATQEQSSFLESLQLQACQCFLFALIALPDSFYTHPSFKKQDLYFTLLKCLHVCIHLGVHMLQLKILELFSTLLPFRTLPSSNGFPLGSNLSLSHALQVQEVPLLSFMDTSLIDSLLTMALTSTSNRPLLHHYIDWITLWLPLVPVFASLSTVLTHQLRLTIQEAKHENTFQAYLRGIQYLFTFLYPQSELAFNLTSSSISSMTDLHADSHMEYKELLHHIFPDLIDLMIHVHLSALNQVDTLKLYRNDPSLFYINTKKRLVRFAQHIFQACTHVWIDALVYDWCLRQHRKFSETMEVAQMTISKCIELVIQRITSTLQPPASSSAMISNRTSYSLNLRHYFLFLVMALENNKENLVSVWEYFLSMLKIVIEKDPKEYFASTVHIFSLFIKNLNSNSEDKMVTQAYQQLHTFLSMNILNVLVQSAPIIDKKLGLSKPFDGRLDYEHTRNLLHCLRKHIFLQLPSTLKDTKPMNDLCFQYFQQALYPILRWSESPIYVDVLMVVESMLESNLILKQRKQELWDQLFLSSSFFPFPTNACSSWSAIIVHLGNSLYYCSELLKKKDYFLPSTLPSKDQELLPPPRCQFFRRLSLLLFSHEEEYFAPVFNSIQEKILECLNSTLSIGLGEGVLCYELFLLFRVMVLKFHGPTLQTLWPAWVHEMMRVFHVCLHSGSVLSRDVWLALLAICKFLDLVFCLKLPEFQIYQSLFIGDSQEQGLFRQLMEYHVKSSELYSTSTSTSTSQCSIEASLESMNSFGSPMLHLTHLSSLYDLIPFYQHTLAFLNLNAFKVQPNLPSIKEWFHMDLALPMNSSPKNTS